MPYLDFGGLRKSGGKSFFRRIPHSTDNEAKFIEAKRKEFKNTDVYRSVYTYETEDLENSRIVGPFYLDFDCKDIGVSFEIIKRQVNSAANNIEALFGIPKQYQELYYSGYKGFHLVISPVIFGFDYGTDYPEKYLKLAKLLRKLYNNIYTHESLIDFQIYDRRRVLRLVNSINSKSGLYKIPITHEELQALGPMSINKLAKSPRNIEIPAPHYIEEARAMWNRLFDDTFDVDIREKEEEVHREKPKTRRALLPCIKNILNTGITEGSRNNTTVALASALFQSGLERDDVLDILIQWNESNVPPLSDTEITTTMMSAQGMVSNDKNYGCPSIINLGLCTPDKCKIANRGNHN